MRISMWYTSFILANLAPLNVLLLWRPSHNIKIWCTWFMFHIRLTFQIKTWKLTRSLWFENLMLLELWWFLFTSIIYWATITRCMCISKNREEGVTKVCVPPLIVGAVEIKVVKNQAVWESTLCICHSHT